MKTRKRSRNSKKKVGNYICTGKDICFCRRANRKEVIEKILNLYKKYYERLNMKDEYLDKLDNDLVKVIDSESDLKKKVNKKIIIKYLNEVPLYYLLSCLGNISYKYHLALRSIIKTK